jgi:three-Cys-motif partner protein
MGNSQAYWSADGSHLPKIDPHTKAKHKILEEYIENLIITLYGKARYGVTTFTFIDGFCGGGMYEDPDSKEQWEGSPIRIIKAVQAGYKKSNRNYPLDVKFIFIDSKKAHLDCLKNYSLPEAGLEEISNSKQCIFECSEFEKLVDWCVLKVGDRKGHSFFLLDPFGWTQVSMSSIRKINSLNGSEILYTYMIDFIERFIIERYDSQHSGFKNVLEADEFYLKADPQKINTVGEQCYLRNESMRLFRERGNAKYVFTFSLISRGDVRVLYYLMHLSKDLTALEVIKESFWKENTLDYQYYFEVYGYGFRASDYYEEDQFSLKFDITRDSNEFCVEKLQGDVGNLIQQNPEGILFRDLCSQTMQLNPASRSHYARYINNLRETQDVEVVRKGEIVVGRKINLQRKDVIRLTRKRQLFMPGLENWIRKL